MTKILVVGTGYVGLVSGACLADFGNYVTCLDIDEEKIECLRRGEIPFYEPGLRDLVLRNVDSDRLSFSTELGDNLTDSQVIVIAVGTPEREDGSADLTAIFNVAEEIGKNLTDYRVIVQKSTVPVGTNKRIQEIISALAGDVEFDMVSNPEFLREGSAIGDFLHPDRVVMGVTSERAKGILKEVYRPLFLNETPILFTSIESAEMIKYAANAFLATKISFINEVAELCEKVDADVQVVSRGMGLDGRIGSKFLHAGVGFGGSCFPKDTKALVHIGRENGIEMGVVTAAIAANERQPIRAVEKLRELVGGELTGLKVAVLGLSFKPNTDDVRESPALKIIHHLREAGAEEIAYDPVAMDNARAAIPDLNLAPGVYQCLHGADALVLATEWNEFRVLDLDKVSSLLGKDIVIDCRNIFNQDLMSRAGLRYASFGRSSSE